TSVCKKYNALAHRSIPGHGRRVRPSSAGAAMRRPAGTSLRRKVMVVVLATTCMALLLSATALLIYQLRSYQKNWLDDLATQARIIPSASRPPLRVEHA